jgi:elongation factor Ts
MTTPELPAKLVMQLRAATGLPMMKCKEALEACAGDFEKAIDWLRKKGLETAAKKADRVMKEGRVALVAAADGRSASMVELDCETEPVCNGPDFKGLTESVLSAVHATFAAKGAGDVATADLLALPLKGGETVDVAVKGLVAKIGENMAARRACSFSGPGRIGTYLHFNAKVGVLAELSGPAAALASPDTKAFLDELGMHVAFAKPAAVARTDVAKEVVDKELEIYREQAKQDPKLSSKPPAVVEKILLGKLDRFYAERCLLEQPWVKDDKQTVKAVLDATSKKAGGEMSIRRVALFQVGGA